jgi:hypothetical protein
MRNDEVKQESEVRIQKSEYKAETTLTDFVFFSLHSGSWLLDSDSCFSSFLIHRFAVVTL